MVISGDVLGYSTLARDPATNTWGIAYGKSASNPRIAIYRDNRILDRGDPGCAQVALATGGGKPHIATLCNAEGIRYITGGVNNPPPAWQSQLVPQPKGGAEAMPYLDIAVDSANHPAVTFWANTDTYNLILGLWRTPPKSNSNSGDCALTSSPSPATAKNSSAATIKTSGSFAARVVPSRRRSTCRATAINRSAIPRSPLARGRNSRSPPPSPGGTMKGSTAGA